MKTMWRKVEPILWFLASLYLFFLVYSLIVYRPKMQDWTFWGQIFVIVVVNFWWTGFKSRLVKFLRESLREMIADELAASRVAGQILAQPSP